jgi:hypothetical protein
MKYKITTKSSIEYVGSVTVEVASYDEAVKYAEWFYGDASKVDIDVVAEIQQP